MIKSIKERWEKIQEDPPGKRFRRQYERRHKEQAGVVKKMLFVGIGIFIVLSGIFFLPAPGPGMLIIFIGLGLISQESLWMAIFMDKLEVRIRKLLNWALKTWGASSIIIKGMIVFLTIAITAGILYGTYLFFLT